MYKFVFTQIVKQNKPKKKFYKEYFLAFFIGGIIGVIAQGLKDIFIMLELEEDIASTMSSLVLISISSVLTFLSIYSPLGQVFGAGLFVPITGFSNSVVSSSLEGKSEGFIKGIGGRIFSLAGSVIAYGIFFSSFVVIIRFLLSFVGVPL